MFAVRESKFSKDFACSAGFGLSRELLQDMGLRANGRKDDSVSRQLSVNGRVCANGVVVH